MTPVHSVGILVPSVVYFVQVLRYLDVSTK